MYYVKIKVGDVYSTVTEAPPHVLHVLAEVCRARPEGYMFMPKFRSHEWDGYISLMRGTRTFPTGLLMQVRDALHREGWRTEIDSYVKLKRDESAPVLSPDLLAGVELRGYQLDAVRDLLAEQRGIAKMATNAGKTVVFAALIKLLGNADAIVTVRSKDLLYQTSERLAQYLGRPVGIIGDGRRDEDDVLVATVQTLNALRKKRVKLSERYEHNRILVVDECHMVAHNQTFDVLMQIPGHYRYGFSGTPLDRGKLNDLKLIACTGEVVVEVSNAELIAEEWSAKPIIFFHDTEKMAGYWETEYQDAYIDCIVVNPQRNEMIADIAKEEMKRGSVLIIVSRIDHGDILHQLIPRSVFVDGSTPITLRQNVLKRLGWGNKMCVIATQIFDEGVDVPALDTLILAGGGKSHIKLLQRIGRGLRRKDGDNVVHIHDFLDCSNEYHLNHAEERVQVYRDEGFEVRFIERED